MQEEQAPKRPGAAVSARPLHFFWLADCSSSMLGDKIEQLNHAIKSSIPEMRTVASENPNAEVYVRAIRFSTGAQWVDAEPRPVDEFEWISLDADGVTDMGRAFELLSAELEMPPMDERGLPPVIILVSDGMPTDSPEKGGLQSLFATPWGKKAVRIAIAIGQDAALGAQSIFEAFIDNPEIPILTAQNPQQLVKYVRWASTTVLKAVSQPASQVGGKSVGAGSVIVPQLPLDDDDDEPVAGIVW